MEAIRNYSPRELAALSDAELDELKEKLLKYRNGIHQDKALRDQPKLLMPTNGLLAGMKLEYERRHRRF
jgi:hypothetical protein